MKTELDEILESKALHDLHEKEPTGGIDLDEEDAESMMSDVLLLLEQIEERPNPKFIHNQVSAMIKRINEVLSFHDVH